MTKSEIIPISPTRRGAWLVNTAKHLLRVDRTDPGLEVFEHTLFAGQCGSLLIKLSCDDEETISRRKLVAHARACGIEQPIMQPYLDVLRYEGAIEWDAESKEYRVLAQSRQRVLRIADKVFLESVDLGSERHAPEILEYCLARPRFSAEVLEALSNDAKEEDVKGLLTALNRFHVLGTKTIGTKTLYFNAYQFAAKAEQIGKALAAFSGTERQELDDLLGEVRLKPGISVKGLKISDAVLKMAVGLGLVDKNLVPSAAGTAEFLTAPLFAPPSVGEETEHLEDDVFNHAKILLSSLRYGEIYSTPGRGRIIDPKWIVNGLLNYESVGPCTAIGQDYGLLEAEGVIRTQRATNRYGEQYSMSLRRREPAQLVKALLQGSADTAAIDVRALPNSLRLPTGYLGPETSRSVVMQDVLTRDDRTMRRFLEALRS